MYYVRYCNGFRGTDCGSGLLTAYICQTLVSSSRGKYTFNFEVGAMAKILIIDSPIKCSNISVTDLGAFCMHKSGPNRCRSYSDNFPKGCPLEDAPTNSAGGKPQEPATNTARDEICPQCKKYALIIQDNYKLCTKCGYASSSGQTSPVA